MSDENRKQPDKPTPADPQRRSLLAGAAGLGLAAGLPTAAAAQAGTAQDQSAEFAGRTAFVTGGARGIGYSCAETLARAGANIVLYDVARQIEHVSYPLATREDLEESQARIRSLGVDCTAVQGDVRNSDELKAAVQQAVAEYGSIDMLIANAGVLLVGQLEQLSDAEHEVMLGVNLTGAIKTVQAAAPVMRRQNSGRIVLMSSMLGRSSSSNFPVYSASKWGMIGLAKSVARQLGKSGVTCNVVCPSLVRTKLVDNEYFLNALFPANPSMAALEEAGRRSHVLPVGFLEPHHVAATVKFICSEAAALISGDVFDVAAGSNVVYPA